MRILVLVPQVPQSLSVEAPWHFLQELRPLAEGGNRVCVLSNRVPDYEFEGVEFRSLAQVAEGGRLRRRTGTLELVARFPKLAAAASSPRSLAQILSVYARNQLVREVVRDFRPHVMHSHWAFPAGSGAYLAAMSEGVPLVMTMRGIEHLKNAQFGYGDCLDPVFETTLRCAIRAASVVTVCCNTTVERLAEMGETDRSRLLHVFHAVDASRCEAAPEQIAAVRERHGLEGSRVVTCVALMDSHRKGHSTLLRSFAQLKRYVGGRERLTLVLVGDGRIRKEIELLADGLGIAGDTRFVGRVHPRSVSHFIGASDFTVLPTHEEVFGNVVFESLSMGVPVISGAVGAAADVLPRGPWGMLVEPGDTDGLARSMAEMLGDLESWRARARDGREYVRTEMTVSRRIDGFLAAYERAISAKPR
jgi:glycosyltransferase involved in cell wall biosynthesis